MPGLDPGIHVSAFPSIAKHYRRTSRRQSASFSPRDLLCNLRDASFWAAAQFVRLAGPRAALTRKPCRAWRP